MNAKRVCVGLLALPVCGVSIVVVVLPRKTLPPGPRFDAAALERVKCGMTEDEITLLVGVPPGDYTTRSDVSYYTAYVGPLYEHPGQMREWRFNSRCARVFFRDGRSHCIMYFWGSRKLNCIERLIGIQIFPSVPSDQ
jgi:hypothetical protein